VRVETDFDEKPAVVIETVDEKPLTKIFHETDEVFFVASDGKEVAVPPTVNYVAVLGL